MKTRYRYRSLDDFLRTASLDVDGCLDDGWGAQLPVKGREIDAAIVFCDISGFSARTLEMTPTETLIFVNNFFAWISAEALQFGNGIVDKYIGDELMVVFSGEFGSEDPVADALRSAHAMCDRDFLSFRPHVGVAAGPVTVGYVGTPLHFNCSVFGAPVALAARCAGFKPTPPPEGYYSTGITFPADLLSGRAFNNLFPPRESRLSDTDVVEQHQNWELLGPFDAQLKNIPNQKVHIAASRALHLPSVSAEERARESLELLRKANRYWPRARTNSDPNNG